MVDISVSDSNHHRLRTDKEQDEPPVPPAPRPIPLLSFAARPVEVIRTPSPLADETSDGLGGRCSSLSSRPNPRPSDDSVVAATSRRSPNPPAPPPPYPQSADDRRWDTAAECTSPHLNADDCDAVAAAILSAPDLAPRFGPADEEREWMAVTPDELREIELDLGGMMRLDEDDVGGASVAVNTSGGEGLAAAAAAAGSGSLSAVEEREAALLPALEAELAAIPEKEKAAYLEATLRCPELVDEEQKKGFLLKEGFDAKLAARGLVLHWQYKRKLFGPEKCYLPLTLSGTLSDDLVALSGGFVSLLPVKDLHGRSVIFVNPSRKSQKYSRESVLRAFWYLLHLANEDPIDRRRGIVVLAYPKEASWGQFDNLLLHSISLLMRYTVSLPRSTHLCHPDTMFHVIKPLIMHACGPRMRKRFRVHYGSTEHILRRLAGYGLPGDRVPSELGGGLRLDPGEWLSARMTREGAEWDCRCSSDAPASILPLAGASEWEERTDLDRQLDGLEPIPWSEVRGNADESSYLSFTEPISATAGTGADQEAPNEACEIMAQRRLRDRQKRKDSWADKHDFPTGVSVFGPQQDEHDSQGDRSGKTSRHMQGDLNTLMEPTRHYSDKRLSAKACHPMSSSDGDVKILPAQTKSKERRQDPRMARAVELKLADPHLPLLDALVAGGFDFPASRQVGQTDKSIKDSDNVSLHQRKNQLCRRLRAKRRDDPRMSRAVAAKSKDPRMPLVDALVAGGFRFADLEDGVAATTVAEKNVRDEDNVSLYSRKKELIRNLAQLESVGEADFSNPAA